MSQILKKLIVLTVICMIIFSTSFAPLCYADDISAEELFKDEEKTWSEVGGTLIDGLVGILTWVFRAPIAAIGLVFQTLITQICGISGAGLVVTPEDIIFAHTGGSGVSIINANFFDFSSSVIKDNSIVKIFRQNVAKWYYALRNISIVISLAVLLYIGIRMAISTIASEKATYKKMLVDWVTGFIVLFLLHYFMIIILNLNDQLVELLYNIHKRRNRR